MTPDSVTDTSICKNEWNLALKYKKPIVLIRVHSDVEVPFRFNSREIIDFSDDSVVCLAKLRQHLQWLQTAEGQLKSLKFRLENAKHDLNRANDSNRPRIENEMKELNEEILRLEKIVENPVTTAAKTKQSIEAGIERERQPPPRLQVDIHSKFVNPPPMSPPDFFQDRYIETGFVSDFLKLDSLRMITLIGRGGVGKTAMVCRLLNALERGELPDDRGKFDVGGIIYHSEVGIHKIGFANLYGDLCRLLPPHIAHRHEQIYKDKESSIRLKMFSLLEEFRSEPIIVLLDNLENTIDPETCSLIPEDLRDALFAFLEAPHHSVKIIITTRIPPNDLIRFHPERQQTLRLDEGLGSPFAENLLRALDSDGTRGLREASDSMLGRIREYTRGFPRALEAFSGSLAADRSTTLEELISKIQDAPQQEIVEIMVGEAFSRLDKSAQIVMQALAIYARPVPSVAVDFLLQPYIKTPDSAIILNRLVNMHFVRRDHGRYSLHPVDLAYALSLIPTEQQRDLAGDQISFSQRELRKLASEYFRQIRRPREEWKTLADIDPQISEFEMRCAAEDYQTALQIVNEIGNNYLSLWGHSRMLIEMRMKLIDKLTDKYSVCQNSSYLGSEYLMIGQSRKVIEYSEHALLLSQKINDSFLEAYNLNSLAIAYRRTGQILKAIEMYEKALSINRKISSRNNEAINLNNLAVAYRYLGLVTKSINFHDQAIQIQENIGATGSMGVSIGTQSISYRNIGQLSQAIECSETALKIARNAQDRHWEAYHLAELGSCYLDLGDLLKSSEFLTKALEISQEIADSHFEAAWAIRQTVKELLWGNLDTVLDELSHFPNLYNEEENYQFKLDYRLVKAMAELNANRLNEASSTLKPIIETEYRLHLPDILALNGVILLRRGLFEEAKAQFIATIELADSLLNQTPRLYQALEAKGLAGCGLALCDKEKANDHITQAIKDYQDARWIVKDPGVIKRALFFFNECVKADNMGILSGVRRAVEG
jgi:tetratricopeptide (TPR) repeat protein